MAIVRRNMNKAEEEEEEKKNGLHQGCSNDKGQKNDDGTGMNTKRNRNRHDNDIYAARDPPERSLHPLPSLHNLLGECSSRCL